MDLDFEELAHDKDLIAKIQQFRDATMRIEDTIKLAANPEVYEKLSNTDKIQHNLLMSYCLNSLFWMYLRAEGKILKKRHQKTFIHLIIKCYDL